MNSLEDAWIGKTLGNCTIQKWLGEGAMANVYEAYHQVLKSQVAVKIMHPTCIHGEQGESYKQRFLREARCASKLHHPNILQLYGVEEDNGTYYIVMELIKGKSLQEIIHDKGPIPLIQALNILKQTAMALKEAHRCGVIHRDVKPGNIMILENGQIKLMDFGLAFSTEERSDISQAGEIIGTIFYMSPEQAMGLKKVDYRCDFYALGITFFQMLAGKIPYQGRTPVQVIEQHISAPIPDIREYVDAPPSLIEILDKLLAKKAHQRFSNADELLAAIDICEQDVYKNHTKSFRNPKSPSLPFSSRAHAHQSPPVLISKNARDRILIMISCVLLVLLIWIGFKLRQPPIKNSSYIKNPPTTVVYPPLINPTTPQDPIQPPLSGNPISNPQHGTTPPVTSTPDPQPNAQNPFIPQFLDILPAHQSQVLEDVVEITGKIQGSVLGVRIGTMPAGNCSQLDDHLYSFSGKVSLKMGANSIPLEAILNDGTVLQFQLLLERTDHISQPPAILPIPGTVPDKSPSSVTRIEVIPSKIQLLPGQVIRFQAKAYNAWDKEETNFQPHWIISGGVLNAEGDYVAGNEPGDFVIIARDRISWVESQAIVQILKDRIGWFGEGIPWGLKRADTPGDYINEKDQSIMVYIPAGTFWMNTQNNLANDASMQQYNLPGFYIDKYELTWQQYLDFCKATHQHKPIPPEFGIQPNAPVVNISWSDAMRYAAWSGKRLPTQLEWEKAARGGDKIPDWNIEQTTIPLMINPYPKRNYPWGDHNPFYEGKFYCNFVAMDRWEDRGKDGFIFTAPVGSFPHGISPYHVYDMAGNVWEWCADKDKATRTNEQPERYIVRGGSWYNHAETCRILRCDAQPDQGFYLVGVRFAR